MAKCPLDEVEEFVEVGDVTHPSQNAKIHWVVNSLSPMKKSRNCAYFDGEISNGKASLRILNIRQLWNQPSIWACSVSCGRTALH